MYYAAESFQQKVNFTYFKTAGIQKDSDMEYATWKSKTLRLTQNASQNYVNPLKPNASICYTLPYRPNLPFLISDIQALSGAQPWACQKLKMVG